LCTKAIQQISENILDAVEIQGGKYGTYMFPKPELLAAEYPMFTKAFPNPPLHLPKTGIAVESIISP
jgi:hypothetical protein